MKGFIIYLLVSVVFIVLPIISFVIAVFVNKKARTMCVTLGVMLVLFNPFRMLYGNLQYPEVDINDICIQFYEIVEFVKNNGTDMGDFYEVRSGNLIIYYSYENSQEDEVYPFYRYGKYEDICYEMTPLGATRLEDYFYYFNGTYDISVFLDDTNGNAVHIIYSCNTDAWYRYIVVPKIKKVNMAEDISVLINQD